MNLLFLVDVPLGCKGVMGTATRMPADNGGRTRRRRCVLGRGALEGVVDVVVRMRRSRRSSSECRLGKDRTGEELLRGELGDDCGRW